MALTITNHLIRSADALHTAGLGDGGGTVTWLPGRTLTEGRAAVIRTAEVASQIPADGNPEVYDEGVLARRGRPGQPARPYRARRHCAGIRGTRSRMMAWPTAGDLKRRGG
jgi:hypothetical protein